MQLYKSALTILAILFLSFSGSSQVKSVEKFLKENQNLSKYFIYQSTLRILNRSGDEDFNKLIKGIRKINVYMTEGTVEVSKSSYLKMLNDLSAENFETLVTAKSDQTLFNLMSREIGTQSYYVLAALEGANFALMEMDGHLDLRYVEAVKNINIDQLRKIVGQDEPEQALDTEEIHD